MSQRRSSLTLDLAESPVSARVLEVSLGEYASKRREEQANRLRAEGHAAATLGAAQALETAAQTLEDSRAGLQESLAETSVQLALEIAQVLLRKELGSGNYDIKAIVHEVLVSSSGSGPLTVLHVHPDDAATLAEVQYRSGTTVEADPSVRRGDVRMHTDQGLLVRNIDSCMTNIRESLQEAFRS